MIRNTSRAGAVGASLLLGLGACGPSRQAPEPRQVTHASGASRAPTWSPEGQRIAFESDRYGDWDLYLIRADGGGLRRLTESGSNRQPSWSPDGTRLVFVSDRTGSPELHVLDVATLEVRQIAALEGHESFPSWSPNGAWIAFGRELVGQFDILRIGVGESVPENLLVGEDRDVWPRWSPNSKRILFFSRRDSGGLDDDVYELDVDSKQVKRMTRRAGHDFCPAWAPDGERFAVVSIQSDASRLIRVLDRNGAQRAGRAQAFARDFYRLTELHWAPQRSAIVFAGRKTEEEPYQVFTLDLD